MTKLYTYKTCTTCKKAKAYLDERGIAYDEIAIEVTAPSVDELEPGRADESDRWSSRRAGANRCDKVGRHSCGRGARQELEGQLDWRGVLH